MRCSICILYEPRLPAWKVWGQPGCHQPCSNPKGCFYQTVAVSTLFAVITTEAAKLPARNVRAPSLRKVLAKAAEALCSRLD